MNRLFPTRRAVAAAACLGAALAVLLVALTASAASTTVTFNPVADSYVKNDQTGSNFGTATTLRVDGDAPVTRAYLRFSVANLTGPVTKAVLRVRATSNHSAGYRVQGVTNTTWGETTITWANAPAISAAVVGSSGAFSSGAWTEVDVTSLVQGNGLVSLALTPINSTGMALSSREGGDKPQLVVTAGGGETTPPSVPGNVNVSATGPNSIAVTWAPSTDNVAVAGYAIYRNGSEVGTTTGASATSFTDGGLAPATSYSYAVDAVDTSGNRSARSGQVSATTNPAPPGGTFAPAADAHVRADQAGTNLGTSTTLRVDGDPATNAYMRFSVQNLTGPVTKAILRVFAITSHPTGYSVSGVANTTWGETTVNYTNAPAIGAVVGSSGSFGANAWTEVDVTPLVTGNGLVSMALTTTNTNSMTLASREGADAQDPQLVVTTGTGESTPPTAPANLVAAPAGSASIALTWSAATDNVAVTGYTIYRAGVKVGTTAGAGATSFTDLGLQPATSYSYRVDAFDAANNHSPLSNVASATTAAGAPQTAFPPVADAYVQSDQAGTNYGTATTVRLDGSPPTNAYLRFSVQNLSGPVTKAVLRVFATTSLPAGYRVSGVANTTWGETTINFGNAPAIGAVVAAPPGSLSANTWTEFDVTPLVSGNGLVSMALTTTNTTAAALSSREGADAHDPQLVVTAGAADTEKPTVPQNLQTAPSGLTAIALTWDASTDNKAVKTYTVYRDGSPVGSPTTNSFTDSGLVAGSTHSYQVDAVDTSNNVSDKSVAVSGSTEPLDTEKPTVPQNLQTAPSGLTAIALTWDASTDNKAVKTYTVYRDGSPVGSPTTNSFTDSGLVAGSTHSYQVDAVDTSNNVSDKSVAVSGSTEPLDTEKPTVPQNLQTAPSGLTAIALTWDASTDNKAVKTYTVYRDGSPVGSPTTNSFTDSGLVAGSTHSYQVDAVDTSNNVSDKSVAVSGSTEPLDTEKPTVPQNLQTAPSGLTAIALTWDASTDNKAVKTYTVYRDGSPVGSPTTNSFTDSGLVAGSTHSYQVDAVDTSNNVSDKSVAVSGSTEPLDTEKPTVPQNLQTAPSGLTAIALTWDASTDNKAVKTYTVYRDGSPVGSPTTNSFTDSGLVAGSTHSYQVDAVDTSNNVSDKSVAVSGSTEPLDTEKPTVPQNLQTAPSGLTAIALTWDASTDNKAVKTYTVYRDGSPVGSPTTNSFTDSGLVAGSTHSYQVDAVDTSNNVSDKSVAVSGSTDPDTTKPTIPQNLAANPASPSSIALTWSASSDDVQVKGYTVYRDGAEVASTIGAGATTYTDTGLAAGSTHSYQVDAVDTSNNRSDKSTAVNGTTPNPSDPVIVAAGDIACDPTAGGFNINGDATNCHMKATSDMILSLAPTAVLTLGDHQYENNTLAKYMGSFDPTWGRFKSLIRPAPGNHEYLTSGATGYYDYFGAAAGDRTKGYYSYDLGAWHMVVLNAECSFIPGGCGATGAQVTWLKADLAAHPAQCTLAYWHEPRFSSGTAHGDNTSVAAFWDALYAGGVDVVLNAHEHIYERWTPMTPAGVSDPVNGIREFIVGTGGKNHYGLPATRRATSQAANADSFGVLKMTLHPTSYDWQFVPEPGKTFTDTGSTNCH